MIRKAALFLILCAVIGAAKVWYDTMRDPVIERFVLESDKMPAGAGPFTIAFITDIHVAGPDMPPSRVEEIVAQVNALDADLIAIGGDLVSEKRVATHIYEAEEIVAPLGKLDAPHGVVFVPGNHDHWYDWPALSAELARYPQITVLENEAMQFGPLAIGGVDDDFVGYADIYATTEAMQPLTGPRIMLTHTPDVFPSLPVNIELSLAGHTHCGQIAYPWGGAPATMSDYGDKYACGVVEENGKTLITSAGLGTSLLPIRLFTHPEIWVIEVRGRARDN
ncbi:metallophosphoesterase [Erythrobacter sp. YT30]|uniref:metallophosphoesterase n=1 Tax=Erythrobacter sp. YT30 TaxID=1735012 RepID=UPI00076D8BD1|nr:metallophosphoesterase [Erythrobacter sp. YT30]KWV92660.1 phosphohydrolase [Erythrobacter sp. YT30]